MFETPEPSITGGGGGGGGPASPPRVPRVPVVPWAPQKVTYAQKARSTREMPSWMIEGEELKSEFPDIEDTYAEYKNAVETAMETKKAAIVAANEAYKVEIRKPRVQVGLTDKIGSFADEAESEEQ